MIQCMAGNCQDIERDAFPDDFIAGMDRVCGTLEGRISRANNTDVRILLLKLFHTAGVIRVVMGDQDSVC